MVCSAAFIASSTSFSRSSPAREPYSTARRRSLTRISKLTTASARSSGAPVASLNSPTMHRQVERRTLPVPTRNPTVRRWARAGRSRRPGRTRPAPELRGDTNRSRVMWWNLCHSVVPRHERTQRECGDRKSIKAPHRKGPLLELSWLILVGQSRPFADRSRPSHQVPVTASRIIPPEHRSNPAQLPSLSPLALPAGDQISPRQFPFAVRGGIHPQAAIAAIGSSRRNSRRRCMCRHSRIPAGAQRSWARLSR